MTDWTTIGVFATMGLFFARGIWDIIGYFLKKKDVTSDSDHSQINSIKNSIVEMRGEQKSILSTLQSIKLSLSDGDNRMDSIDKDIRNIQEALNRIEIFHNAQHKERMGIPEIIKKA